RNVLAVEADGAGLDAAILGQQANHRLGGGGLARTAFANQCHDFAGGDGEAHLVGDAGGGVALAIGDGEVLDRKERRGHFLPPSDWLMRLAESTVSTTTTPGAV